MLAASACCAIFSQHFSKKVYGHCDKVMEADADDPEGLDVRSDGKVWAYGKWRMIHYHRPLAEQQLIARQRHITSRAARRARKRQRERSDAGNSAASEAEEEATAAAAVVINPIPPKVRKHGRFVYS